MSTDPPRCRGDAALARWFEPGIFTTAPLLLAWIVVQKHTGRELERAGQLLSRSVQNPGRGFERYYHRPSA